MSINQVIFHSVISASDGEVRALVAWGDLLEDHVEVGGLGALLLVAFWGESQAGIGVHTCLNFNLLVTDRLGVGFAVKSNGLLLVADSFDAAVVKFFQSCGDNNLDGLHWGQLGLVNTSKGTTEERSLYLSAIFVADIVKSIVFQEVVVKNSVAILLVNVTTGE